MSKPSKLILCLFFFLCCFREGYGQVFDDWEGRGDVAGGCEFDNGLSVRGRYRHSLDNNLSHYKKSVLGLKINYQMKITSWMKPAIDY